MDNWTENDKKTYLGIVKRLAQHGTPLSQNEIDKLSNHVKYALIDLYRDSIDKTIECPNSTWQKIKNWFNGE